MTRRFILTTATLATFMTTGGILPSRGPAPSTTRLPTTTSQALAWSAPEPAILELGPHLVGITHPQPPIPGQDWPVALLLDGALAPGQRLDLWIGLKNGWGSTITTAQAEAGMPGWFTAQVPVPDPLHGAAQLWLGLEQGQGPTIRRALTLPV